MARMIRKQIYLETRQQVAVSRAARLHGMSEAAVIRRAIELASRAGTHHAEPDAVAWKQALAVMWALKRRAGRAERRRWTREDLYEDRLKRYVRRPG